MGSCVYVPLPPLRGQHTVLCHPRWQPTSGMTEFSVCWGGAGFEPRITDLQSGVLPLSHLSSYTFLNSMLTRSVSAVISVSLSRRVVSSANRKLSSLEQLGRSFIYTRNNRGPSIEPWGTPSKIWIRELEWPFITTNCWPACTSQCNTLGSVNRECKYMYICVYSRCSRHDS